MNTNDYKKLRQQNTHKPKPSQCTTIQKGCHESVNEITPSNILHAPVQDSETKIPRITANDKVAKYSYDDVQNDFRPFLFDGFVSSGEGENKTPIRILRDTCSSKSLLLKNAIDLNDASYTGHKILIQGVNMECSSIPLHIINLECDLINKNKVTVGVVSSLPCEGISLLLGNDLAGGKVEPDVITSDTPSKLINNDVCNVVTRSSHKVLQDVEVPDNSHDLENTFMNTTDEYIINIQHLSCNKAKIIIEPSNSDFSSPSMLVSKPDGTYRFVTNFKTVNAITKYDSYPIPRIEDCIDKIDQAKYVSKFDLLKGFWQVPLTERAKRVSAFATPDGLYQYRVMPFGMRNSPATFQRLINRVISGLTGCEAYIDDLVLHSDSWNSLMQVHRALFIEHCSIDLEQLD